jgi:hypothetical protein
MVIKCKDCDYRHAVGVVPHVNLYTHNNKYVRLPSHLVWCDICDDITEGELLTTPDHYTEDESSILLEIFSDRSIGAKCLECGINRITLININIKEIDGFYTVHPGCGGTLYYDKSGSNIHLNLKRPFGVSIYDSNGSFIEKMDAGAGSAKSRFRLRRRSGLIYALKQLPYLIQQERILERLKAGGYNPL